MGYETSKLPIIQRTSAFALWIMFFTLTAVAAVAFDVFIPWGPHMTGKGILPVSILLGVVAAFLITGIYRWASNTILEYNYPFLRRILIGVGVLAGLGASIGLSITVMPWHSIFQAFNITMLAEKGLVHAIFYVSGPLVGCLALTMVAAMILSCREWPEASAAAAPGGASRAAAASAPRSELGRLSGLSARVQKILRNKKAPPGGPPSGAGPRASAPPLSGPPSALTPGGASAPPLSWDPADIAAALARSGQPPKASLAAAGGLESGRRRPSR
ncbi:MAG TPA: hypothetical protein VJB02_06900 [Coxiellaceae bacterium]|nr:hypothetical protein [Coxiellaceae bacterium]